MHKDETGMILNIVDNVATVLSDASMKSVRKNIRDDFLFNHLPNSYFSFKYLFAIYGYLQILHLLLPLLEENMTCLTWFN